MSGYSPMSGRAVTKKTVKKLVDPVPHRCDLATPGICMAPGSGRVQRYEVIDEGREVHACPACYEHMIATGQWADKP